MFYTGKGDDGKTSLFGSSKRFKKSEPVFEALGTLDELNCVLGLARTAGRRPFFKKTLEEVQQNLFLIQAELAGAGEKMTGEKIEETEDLIKIIGKKLPPLKNFVLPGTCELSAWLDYARAMARRAERRAWALKGEQRPGKESLIYLNRLSSLLFFLARSAAHQAGKKEKKPSY